MVVIESKRKKRENILKSYPEAVIIDITSKAEDDFVRLSPFYPHGGIPVPYSNGVTAACVEGIWQGLKVFEQEGIDTSLFANSTMKNIKRSVRTHGRVLGHRKGVNSSEILSYVEAKHSIYIPAYKWTLEHKTQDLVEKIRQLSSKGVVVLLDYNTCCDVDATKPLSHAFLVKAYAEGYYPYGEKRYPTEEPIKKKSKKNTSKKKKEIENDKQLSLF